MASPNIIAGRQHTPRVFHRRVCFVGSLGSNSTERATADRSRSTSHIDVCWRSVGVVASSPSPRPRVTQKAHHKQIGS
jgi:hypothetical protein